MSFARIALLVWLIGFGLLHFAVDAQDQLVGQSGKVAKAKISKSSVTAVKTSQGLEIRLGETMRESPYMNIYDVNGRMIKVVSMIGFGSDRLEWNYTAYDGSKIKPGMYLVDVHSGKLSEKIKVKVYQ